LIQEVRHELVYNYAGGSVGTLWLGETPSAALVLVEMMQGRGALPPPLLP